MLTIALIAGSLVAVTVAVHAAGLAALLRSLMTSHGELPSRFWPIAWMLIRVTWILILIHLVEIAVWALFYVWSGSLPDAEAAFYFSGVTYATVGYGDLVLQEPWRMLAPVEGLTGILMGGLSTGFFFAVLSKVFVINPGATPIGGARK
jgi:Ion channel